MMLILLKNYNSSSVAVVAEEHKNIEKTYAGWYGSLITRMFRNKKTTNSKGWCMKQLIHLLNQSREK